MSLDEKRLTELLEKADRAWFLNHSGQFAYREHLEFVAGYLAHHYKE